MRSTSASEKETDTQSEAADACKTEEKDSSLNVLVVDDNAMNRNLAKRIFTRLNYPTTVVDSGIAAIEACVEMNFDVVFMDIEMPEMGGVEATALLRSKIPPSSHPYMVALTANTDPADRDSYLRSGLDDFLGKPIVLSDVVSCLGRAAAFTSKR